MSSATVDNQLPELIRILEVTLRSGYNIKQSLEIIVKDMAPPITAEIQQVLDDLNVGRTIPQALHDWLMRTQHPDLDLLIATFKVQFEVGGNLADKLQLLSQIMEKRQLS